LLVFRDETRSAARQFPFLSLVRVPDYREEDKEHVDVRGREGLLDLNVEDVGLDRCVAVYTCALAIKVCI